MSEKIPLFRPSVKYSTGDKANTKIIALPSIHVWSAPFLILISCFFFSFLFIPTLNKSKTVQGELISSVDTINLTIDRAMYIEEIYVKNSDYVREGDPLLKLKTNKLNEHGEPVTQEVRKLLEVEENKYRESKANIDSKFTKEVSSIENTIDLYKKKNKALLEKYEILLSLSNIHENRYIENVKLWENRLIDKTKIENLETGKFTSKLQVKEAELTLIELERAISDLESRKSEVELEYEKALIDVEYAYKIRIQDLKNAMNENVFVLASPGSGYVDSLLKNTNQIVKAGENILNIVAKNEEHELYARLSSDDSILGVAELGMTVYMKVSAYPVEKYGLIQGVISKISKSSTIFADGEEYFPIEVSLTNQEEKNKEIVLKPGMKLTAEISIAKTSLLNKFQSTIFR